MACLFFISFSTNIQHIPYLRTSVWFASTWSDLDNFQKFFQNLREGVNEKKRFLSGIARMMGGGPTHARIFWPSF